MKNILVIGSTGQIGSELTRELRKNYGNDHVVAGYIPGAEPKGELLESGPAEIADVTNGAGIAEVAAAMQLEHLCVQQLGEDILVEGTVKRHVHGNH